jgi:hypothetical protein
LLTDALHREEVEGDGGNVVCLQMHCIERKLKGMVEMLFAYRCTA